MLNVVRALAVALALTSIAHAQNKVDPQKEADIRRLLTLTGASAMGQQVAQQMIVQMKQAMPNVPDEFWDKFAAQAKPQELLDMVVPVYDRHLSDDDIKAAIKFYETPAGQHFTAALPKLTQESMLVGSEWGRNLANRVIEQLKQQEDKAAKKKK